MSGTDAPQPLSPLLVEQIHDAARITAQLDRLHSEMVPLLRELEALLLRILPPA
jgi:hypothetical protein